MKLTSLQSAYGLDGKLALVTGGGTGIGLAISQCLHACGARVIIGGRRSEVLRKACDAIGDDTVSVSMDVTDTGSLAGIEERIFEEHGPVDILVN